MSIHRVLQIKVLPLLLLLRIALVAAQCDQPTSQIASKEVPTITMMITKV